MDVIVILLAVLCAFIVGFYLGPRLNRTQEQKNIEFRYNQMLSTNLWQNGITSLWKPENWPHEYFSYDIRSWDGGKTWYALETEAPNSTALKDGRIIILGEVEKVYPGFLEHNKTWDRLREYVRKNGPIGSGQSVEEIREILDGTGFEVSEKTNIITL